MNSEHSAVYCEHANEVPGMCPCDDECYCKTHTCAVRSVIEERPSSEALVVRLEAEVAMLKRCVFDTCFLHECISDDVDLVDIGQDDEGRWIAWHVEYPEEGHVRLVDEKFQIVEAAQLKVP